MKLYTGRLGIALLGIFFGIFTDALMAADAATASVGGSSAMGQGLLLVAFAVIFYFLIMRPQSKRAKDHQQLISGIQKGDEVITTGGILGKITRVGDNFFIIAIAEGVEVPIQKQAIATSVPKGTLKSI
jgi:preprotein translocase subunit YajC